MLKQRLLSRALASFVWVTVCGQNCLGAFLVPTLSRGNIAFRPPATPLGDGSFCYKIQRSRKANILAANSNKGDDLGDLEDDESIPIQDCYHQRCPPLVWIQPAEADFVEDEENLEEGEICRASYRAFASSLSTTQVREPRFLGAGALVQRHADTQVCDAWMGEAPLEEGGPNLQFQGACQIFDQLLVDHLTFHRKQSGATKQTQGYEKNDEKNQMTRNFNPIEALQTFVVQCGGENDDKDDIPNALQNPYVCASYLAATSRGCEPLEQILRVNSIYTPTTYEHNSEGMVLNLPKARQVYHDLLETARQDSMILDSRNSNSDNDKQRIQEQILER